MGTVLRRVAHDKEVAEEYLGTSGLDWTAVYPPMLTNGPLSASYSLGKDLSLKGVARVSRADVAHIMLAQLHDTTHRRKIVIGAHRSIRRSAPP